MKQTPVFCVLCWDTQTCYTDKWELTLVNCFKKTDLPSCRHTGLSLGFQLREPLKCLTQSFFEVPLSLYPSWQWNRTTTLSKKTPALGVLYPCSGAPGSAQACRSSNPKSDKDTIKLCSFTPHAAIVTLFLGFSIWRLIFMGTSHLPLMTTSNPTGCSRLGGGPTSSYSRNTQVTEILPSCHAATEEAKSTTLLSSWPG